MTASSLPSRRPPRRWSASLFALLAVLSLAACSGDDDASADTAANEATAAAPTTAASDEEPPGTDPGAVEPYIQDLLTRYDEVVSQIVADPAIAANREHELYTQLKGLISPDAPMTEPIINALVARGEQGVSQRPYDEGGMPVTRQVDGDVTSVSADEVSFPVCTLLNYKLFDSLDRETEFQTDLAQPGQGAAVRIDGRWRISQLDGVDEAENCREDHA